MTTTTCVDVCGSAERFQRRRRAGGVGAEDFKASSNAMRALRDKSLLKNMSRGTLCAYESDGDAPARLVAKIVPRVVVGGFHGFRGARAE